MTHPTPAEAVSAARARLARAQAKVAEVVPDERLGNYGLTSAEIARANRLRRARDTARFALEDAETALAAAVLDDPPAAAAQPVLAVVPAAAGATFSH